MAADAYRLQKAIEAETIEIEENGIKIIMGGDLKVKKIIINNSEHEILKNAINMAIRKAQEMMVTKMREMVDLNNIS